MTAPWTNIIQNIPSGINDSGEAMRAAGLDWNVEKKNMVVLDGNRQTIVPDRYAIVRRDTDQVIATVGKKYNIVQNRDAFRFFDQHVRSGDAEFTGGGYIKDGRVVFLQAKINNVDINVGDDIVEPYLLIITSHDGTKKTHIMITPVRMACTNMLALALRSSSDNIAIMHTATAHQRLSDHSHQIQQIRQKLSEARGQYEHLQDTEITPEQLEKYSETMFPYHGEGELPSQQTINLRERYLETYENGIELDSLGNTWYRAYNAYTEFYQHYRYEDEERAAISTLSGRTPYKSRSALKLALLNSYE